MKQGGLKQYAIIKEFVIKQDPESGKTMTELIASHLSLHSDQSSSFQDIRRKNKIFKDLQFGHIRKVRQQTKLAGFVPKAKKKA
jgi:hypothetical protein